MRGILVRLVIGLFLIGCIVALRISGAVGPPTGKTPRTVTPANLPHQSSLTRESDFAHESLMGEVVDSSSNSLSVRVGEGDTASVVLITIRLKTRFKPFRRPAVGENVRVEVTEALGEKFAQLVEIIMP